MFVGLVVVHELGHFIVARRNGVKAEEFGIGFPPTALKRRIKSAKGDFDLSLNWLPVGGFVRLKGENDSDTAAGSFGAAPLWSKVKIMLAGVVMNLLVAFLLLTVVALLGMPKIIDNQFQIASDARVSSQRLFVGFVEDESPAARAGLVQGDELIAVTAKDSEGAFIASQQPIDQFPVFTSNIAGERVEIEYVRDGQQQRTEAQLRSSQEVQQAQEEGTQKGYFGIIPSELLLHRSTWSAPLVAGGLIGQFTVLTLEGVGSALWNLVKGDTEKASEQVAGPVGIVNILRQSSDLGIEFILLIVAVISLTLAIMNTLPIPALDGGRLFVTLLFRLLKKPLSKETEEKIHGTGFLLLIMLFILITTVDVRRILGDG
jgi:regulator of sigma E protease